MSGLGINEGLGLRGDGSESTGSDVASSTKLGGS